MKQISVLVSLLMLALAGISQAMPTGLHVNDKAPMFTAKDQNGNTISLAKMLQKGPVVIVFYRGEWCPYCNRQLSQLQDSASYITGKGASLVAVSPEKPESINKTISKTKAAYPVLSDEGMKIMNSYQVTYTIDSATVNKYKNYGIDFNDINGSNGEHLPVPAVYVINKKGIIQFVHFDPDYTKRASVKEIMTYL